MRLRMMTLRLRTRMITTNAAENSVLAASL